MVSKRNTINKLINYLESLGIEINIAKNNARGNKGFFKAKGCSFRIDIAKNQSEDEVLRILTHEFAHFVHYNYDKTLKSLDFIFNNNADDYIEEMIKITVDSIPKTNILPLFEKEAELREDIEKLTKFLKERFPDFKNTVPYKFLEKKVKNAGFEFLLKYDKVKVLKGFSIKLYSIDSLDSYLLEEETRNYILLKSKQRQLKKYKSKISRLNKYYNSETELFARSLEFYFFNTERMAVVSPYLYDEYEKVIIERRVPELNEWHNLIKT